MTRDPGSGPTLGNPGFGPRMRVESAGLIVFLREGGSWGVGTSGTLGSLRE